MELFKFFINFFVVRLRPEDDVGSQGTGVSFKLLHGWVGTKLRLSPTPHIFIFNLPEKESETSRIPQENLQTQLTSAHRD